MHPKVVFDEDTILRLFGNEAAENEPIERLKEYYFKNSIFNQVVCDAPLRILVGHKGIGKSALLKIARYEDEDKGYLSILIKPDDIIGIAEGSESFLTLIRDWKTGLLELLAHRALASLGVSEEEGAKKGIKAFSGKLISFIDSTITAYKDKVSRDPAKKLIVDQFLKQKRIIVYIDDLDRGWEGRPQDIKRISALLNAVRDLTTDTPSLMFRISLRSDVYFLVRTSDESTDKIESSVIWYSWTNHEILILLMKRIETFFSRQLDEQALLKARQVTIAHYLNSIFEERFTGQGRWENAPMYRILMSLIRKRPRDLVKLCTSAARKAKVASSPKICTEHLTTVFDDYSQGRIQDTINEYKTELPDIKRLLMGMKPSKRQKTAKENYYFTTDQLLKKINSVMQSGKFIFATGKEADEKDLAHFMYKINFLNARKELSSGKKLTKYFEENRYISDRTTDFGYDWEIHPAYRWALQPDSIMDIYKSLHLPDDE